MLLIFIVNFYIRCQRVQLMPSINSIGFFFHWRSSLNSWSYSEAQALMNRGDLYTSIFRFRLFANVCSLQKPRATIVNGVWIVNNTHAIIEKFHASIISTYLYNIVINYESMIDRRSISIK